MDINIFEAIILGIVQGITEFLPISSTGHLTLTGKFMNLISAENPEHWTAFIAILQLGTLLSIVIYFWKDIWNILISFFKENIEKPFKYKEQSLNSRMGWLIIAGTVPVGVVGLLFKDIIEGSLTKNLYVIAGSLIGLALVLAIAEKTAKHKKEIDKVTFMDAIVVGVAQAMALIPGSSRSGTTITGGLFCGFTREAAARFSFLLSIPAIFLSGMLEVYEAYKLGAVLNLPLVIGTIVSFISGYLAIDFLLKFLKKHSTFVFIFYRIALGVIIYILLFNGIIKP